MSRRVVVFPRMEASPLHPGDENSDGDIDLTVLSTTVVFRSRSWSSSFSSGDQSAEPSSTDESASMTVVSSEANHENIRSSIESDGMTHARPANDDLPSVGANLHESGRCRPCLFVKSAAGCMHGQLCPYCHHPDHAGVSDGLRSRRPSKGIRLGLRKRMNEIAESNISEDMKKEEYLRLAESRLAETSAYVTSLLKEFHPDVFAGDWDTEEATGVSAVASYFGASAASSMTPAAPWPRMPGLQREAQWITAPCAPAVPDMLPRDIPEKQNNTKVSL
eukprot:TRINITY_DN18084_c0_g1_i2.p1 TRINITY_DN18084_c0_g1~~TRINITY_DN18084_c0_g1_i2.p1  ORF type:complete len:277 (-),score=27.00 TRINITY_DN18084_c0_g1_i2:290-1120(-)